MTMVPLFHSIGRLQRWPDVSRYPAGRGPVGQGRGLYNAFGLLLRCPDTHPLKGWFMAIQGCPSRCPTCGFPGFQLAKALGIAQGLGSSLTVGGKPSNQASGCGSAFLPRLNISCHILRCR